MSSCAALAVVSVVIISAGTTVSGSALNFVVIGDWGGVPIFPYYTPSEKDVAKAMGNVAEKVNSNFTVALGDNFYFTGVSNVQDSRFKETYEVSFSCVCVCVRACVRAGGRVRACMHVRREGGACFVMPIGVC